MRGLTLYEPYASLVACGAKTIETRSWKTGYRGEVLIHAGSRRDRDVQTLCLRAASVLAARKLPQPRFQFGKIVAIARLADCQPMADCPDGQGSLNDLFGAFGPGRVGWVLESVRPLAKPVKWRGALGLWTVPEELLQRVLEQVELAETVIPSSRART